MTEQPETNAETTDTRAEAADEARHAVQQAALRHVTATGGQLVVRPLWPGCDHGTVRDAEPLAGIASATALERAAISLKRDYLGRARGAGTDWDQIASALGLEDDQENYKSRAELAYEYAAGEPWRWGDPRSFSYTCSTCTQRVTDHGPYDSHPADRESGHAEDCGRLTADVAAWQADRDREDAEYDAAYEAGQ